MAIRPYADADRIRALSLGVDPRTIDDPRAHIHVADDATADGVGVWFYNGPDAPAEMALIIISDWSRTDLFWQLARAAAEEARDLGVKEGTFTLIDAPTFLRVRSRLPARHQVAGRHVPTGRAVSWRFDFDLADVARQLQRIAR